MEQGEALQFRLRVDSLADDTFVVERFSGHETLNELYRLELFVRTSVSEEEIVTALGRDAHFYIDSEAERRVFHGVVASLGFTDAAPHGPRSGSSYRVVLVPRAWLMSLRRNSRIFQGERVDAIVREVLAFHGIPSRWLLAHPLPSVPYCTQYEETDLAFVKRLLAEAGIHFHFEQPYDEEALAAAGIGEAIGQAVSAGIGAVQGAIGGGGQDVAGSLLDHAASVFGWVGGLREIMVFADSALFYPPLQEEGAIDWAEQLAMSARQQGAQALGALTSAAGDALGEVNRELGQAGGEVLGAVGQALGAELAKSASRVMHYRPDSGALQATRHDTVTALRKKRRVHSLAATFRHYDPERPHAMLEAHSRDRGELADLLSDLLEGQLDPERIARQGLDIAGDVAGQIGGPAGDVLAQGAGMAADILGVGSLSARSEIYEHQSHFLHEEWSRGRTEPERILAAAKRNGSLSQGESICPWLASGRRFTMSDHPLPSLNDEHVIVHIEHEGTTFVEERTDERVYINRFRSVPARVHFVPERPHRRSVNVCQTATVVGASEIDTNEQGQVCVRFHWDRRPAGNVRTTCWLRAMQTWAGGGFGAQFIPRKGMEVVVAFDGGDPDRPIVLGCVYNAVAPPPFQLPQRKTVSGIRTQSSPGGDGGNELSFDDAAGQERVHIHAERNLEIVVDHDRQVDVEHDDELRVRGERREIINGAANAELRGSRSVAVAHNDATRVEGNRGVSTQGDESINVRGDRRLQIGGAHSSEVSGAVSLSARADLLQRVGGNMTTVVGSHDAPKMIATEAHGNILSSSTGITEIRADSELLIHCGPTMLRLTPERAELVAEEVILQGKGSRIRLQDNKVLIHADERAQAMAETVAFSSNGAAIALGSEAQIDGARVLLNSPETASDEIDNEEPEPTIIELVDQAGEPLPNRPFRIVLSDGSEMSGVLDEEGRASVALEEEAEIYFPGLHELEPA